MDHKHIWKRSTRKHKRNGRIFVECTVPGCGIIRQATTSFGHLNVFHTGVLRVGGKTTVKSYRLKQWQNSILANKGVSFVQFVDEAFQKENIPAD